MEKIYRLLDWLTLEQAVDWLQDLTNTQLTESQLSQLCEARQCNAYMDVDCLHGWGGNHEVCGNGIHRLLTTSAIKYAQAYKVLDLTFEGPVCLSDGDMDDSSWGTWQARVEFPHRKPCFKPADIQALAVKMNGGAGQPTAADFESLRLQLEKTQSELKIAKAAYETLRCTAGLIRQQTAAYLAENTQLRGELADSVARLKQQPIDLAEQPDTQSEAPATGLTFPYTTKHLEAMRDAALKYWPEYDRAKPAPYGIQKSVQNFLAERTGENARKVAELAVAIKPDGLPKS